MREGRARQHRDRRVGAGLARDVVEQLAAALLDALRAEDQRLARTAGARSSTERMCCAGVTTSQASHSPSSARSRRRADRAVRAGLPGRKTRILVARVDRLDDLVLERPQQASRARRPRRPARARCPRRRRRSPPKLHAFTPAPRTFSALLVERPAGPRRSVERIGEPGGEALGPGPGDHRRIVGAQPAGRHAEPAAAASPARSAERGADRPGWRRLRRRRPAPARRCVSQREPRSGRPGSRRPPAGSSRRCRRGGARPRRPRAGPRSSGRRRRNAARPSRPAAAAAARPSDRPGCASCLDRRPAGIIAGRAAWPPCRTPRRRRRRWSSPAAGSRRRRAPRAAGNARPTPAAADRETRGRDRPAAGDSAWPSR